MNAQLKPSESEEASTPLLRIDAAGSELLRPAEQWRAFLLPIRNINNLTNWHKFHVYGSWRGLYHHPYPVQGGSSFGSRTPVIISGTEEENAPICVDNLTT